MARAVAAAYIRSHDTACEHPAMSVAFRRESDEEHREPRFERPIAPGPNRVTERGRDRIAAEVERLRAAVAAADVEAERDALARDLRYWTTRLATAEVMPPPEAGVAGFGSTVRFRLAGADRRLTIVGGDEAEPDDGTVSFTAPLARALDGAMAGERVAFHGADGALHILEVIP